MRHVRSIDTTPEKKVRSLLHKLGYRFRLHRNDLPGKPDIVLLKHRTVVFVHGCFWHRHHGCSHATTPASSQTYWLPKFRRTVERDKRNQEILRKNGWNVVIVWECETKDLSNLSQQLDMQIKGSLLYQQSLSMALAAEPAKDYHANNKCE